MRLQNSSVLHICTSNHSFPDLVLAAVASSYTSFPTDDAVSAIDKLHDRQKYAPVQLQMLLKGCPHDPILNFLKPDHLIQLLARNTRGLCVLRMMTACRAAIALSVGNRQAMAHP